MKKILIPTDGSELADFAYCLANKVAQKTGAQIDILSIIPAPADAFFDPQGNLKDDEGEDYSEYYTRQAAVQQQMNDWVKDKSSVSSVTVKVGRVDEDITQYVKNHSIDMVVMGMHSHHGVSELLRESHVNHIADLASIPILSLKCDRGNMEVNDIVLVSDFVNTDGLKLNALKELVAAFGAKLHLLKINTPKHFCTQIEARSRMEHFAYDNGLEGAVYHLYSDNSIEEGIEHFSLENQIDVITLGFKPPQGLNRWLNQDISKRIVNHLYHPILTLPN